MTEQRLYGTIVAFHGALIVRRDDGGDDAFLSRSEAAKAGITLAPGDRVEFSVAPGSAVVDVMLCAYSGERYRL
jgi:cold shock CspA family protein